MLKHKDLKYPMNKRELKSIILWNKKVAWKNQHKQLVKELQNDTGLKFKYTHDEPCDFDGQFRSTFTHELITFQIGYFITYKGFYIVDIYFNRKKEED